MPNEAQSIIPMISYEDGVGALDWLAMAFGFLERTRIIGPDGRLAHGEMEYGDSLIMLATPTTEYECPKRHRERCARAREWSIVPWVIDGALVYVDNLDEHYERAKSAGAVILSEPEDGGPGRRYRAEDIEGHRWMFLERKKS
jgi:PhnB protein